MTTWVSSRSRASVAGDGLVLADVGQGGVLAPAVLPAADRWGHERCLLAPEPVGVDASDLPRTQRTGLVLPGGGGKRRVQRVLPLTGGVVVLLGIQRRPVLR